MAQLFFLGPQVVFGMWSGRDFAGYAFHHLDPSIFKSSYLIRVIRQETDLMNTERLQNLPRQRKFAVVSLKTETLVGLDGVQACILQRVGLQLGHQAYAAAFLLFVHQHSRTLSRNHCQGHL